MIILGIETSCDETALCLLETREVNEVIEYRVLGNIINSQIQLHREYGGVFPVLAKREHTKNLPILFEQVMKESGITEDQISAIAVTRGPGLEPALWTGIVFAKELHEKFGIPVIPVNHMEGHIVSTLFNSTDISRDFQRLKPLSAPALALLISGGHTEIVYIEKLGEYKILGRTRDDAVGEAFDKVARMIGLPYPGGPEISKLAQQARLQKLPRTITLPRPMIHSKDLDFSFSGLKTSVLYLLKEKGEITRELQMEIAREFEEAVTDVLVKKLEQAITDRECKTIIIGGGVIANTYIRSAFEQISEISSIPLYLPAQGLTGDNALMIALAGALNYSITKDPLNLTAQGNLSL